MFKRMVSWLLILSMVLSMNVTVFAADTVKINEDIITVELSEFNKTGTVITLINDFNTNYYLLTEEVGKNNTVGMMVKKLDAVAVQFFRNRGDIIVQKGKEGKPVPTEMGAEKHCGGYVCFRIGIGFATDLIQIVGIGPLQVGQVIPPSGDAVGFGFHRRPP